MDIYKEWQKLQVEKFSEQLNENTIMEAIKKESRMPVHELIKRLGYKIRFVVFFIVLFSTITVFQIGHPDRFLIGLGVSLVYIIGGLLLWQQHRKLKIVSTQVDENLLGSLTSFHRQIDRTIRYENLFGLFFMPVALIGGFFFGASAGGKSPVEMLSDPTSMLILLGLLIVLAPLGYWAGKKMNQIAFGEYLSQLAMQIEVLKGA